MVFLKKRQKRRQTEKRKKVEKNFEKGLALFTVLEYNTEDVCKGDEVTDCSLAGEVTATDHVRESDDGSRPLCRAKKAKQSYLSTNKEET